MYFTWYCLVCPPPRAASSFSVSLPSRLRRVHSGHAQRGEGRPPGPRRSRCSALRHEAWYWLGQVAQRRRPASRSSAVPHAWQKGFCRGESRGRWGGERASWQAAAALAAAVANRWCGVFQLTHSCWPSSSSLLLLCSCESECRESESSLPLLGSSCASLSSLLAARLLRGPIVSVTRQGPAAAMARSWPRTKRQFQLGASSAAPEQVVQ